MNGKITGVIVAGLAVAILTGCASTPDANYSRYVDSIREQQAAEAQQIAALASAAAACNGDSTCVVSVAGFAALAVQGGASRGQQIQQYVRQRGAWENITLGVLGALPGLGQTYAAIDAGRNSVRIAEVNAGRELGMIEAMGNVTGRVADAFAMLPPSTYVGGDLISGTQHIGDTVGRDQISGQQHIGDWRTGDDIRRDTIGGDRTDYGTGNRIDSPGPYDYDDVGNEGPRCTGAQCQQAPVPETEDGE